MRLARTLGASLLLVCSAPHFATGQAREDFTVPLMERARAKDTAGVKALCAQAPDSPPNRYACHLARYIADPEDYAETFVREFPAGEGEVMGYVYSLELATDMAGRHLTPYFLYAFDQLGKLAIKGSARAVGTLYRVTLNSDAVVSESACFSVTRVIAERTSTALRELEKLAPDQRARIYLCFATASQDESRSMRSALEQQTAEPDRALVQEMLHALDTVY